MPDLRPPSARQRWPLSAPGTPDRRLPGGDEGVDRGKDVPRNVCPGRGGCLRSEPERQPAADRPSVQQLAHSAHAGLMSRDARLIGHVTQRCAGPARRRPSNTCAAGTGRNNSVHTTTLGKAQPGGEGRAGLPSPGHCCFGLRGSAGFYPSKTYTPCRSACDSVPFFISARNHFRPLGASPLWLSGPRITIPS